MVYPRCMALPEIFRCDACCQTHGRRYSPFCQSSWRDPEIPSQLTLAWMRLVAAALVETPESCDFTMFLAEHPELGDKDLLKKYYSPQALQANAAREAW